MAQAGEGTCGPSHLMEGEPTPQATYPFTLHAYCNTLVPKQRQADIDTCSQMDRQTDRD